MKCCNAELRGFADDKRWPLPNGPRKRRVLEGAYQIAYGVGDVRFSRSYRSWGEVVGIPWQATGHAVRLLRRDRLVLRVKPASGYQAATYRLGVPRPLPSTIGPSPVDLLFKSGPNFNNRTYVLAHDAFRPQALGDAGWLVLRWLDPERPLEPAALASVTGLPYRVVLEVCDRVHAAEVATAIPGGWVSVPDDELGERLDRYAMKAGTWGMLSVQRSDQERQRYRSRGEPLPTQIGPVTYAEAELRMVVTPPPRIVS